MTYTSGLVAPTWVLNQFADVWMFHKPSLAAPLQLRPGLGKLTVAMLIVTAFAVIENVGLARPGQLPTTQLATEPVNPLPGELMIV